MKHTALFTAAVFTLFSIFSAAPAYADAWTDYQTLKADQAAQNKQLMKDFSAGKISAGQLENEWKNMHDAAAAAAGKVAQEWKDPKPDEAASDEAGDPQPPAPPPAPPVKTESGLAEDGMKLPLPGGVTESGSGGRTPTSFAEAGGLEVEQDTIEYRHGTEGVSVRKISGLKKFTNIVMKRGVIGDIAFWNWIVSSSVTDEALQDVQGAPLPEGGPVQPGLGSKKQVQKTLKKAEADYKATSAKYDEALGQFMQTASQAHTSGRTTGVIPSKMWQSLIAQWLIVQLLILYLIFMIRVQWLYGNYLGAYFSLQAVNQFAAGVFGSDPSRNPIGPEVVFGNDQVQVQHDHFD